MSSKDLIQISGGFTHHDSTYWGEADTLQAILDHISDGVIAYGPDQRIVSFNRSAEEITGYTRAEAIGKTCADIFRCERCDPTCGIMISLQQLANLKDCEVRLERKDGAVRMARVNTAILFDKTKQPAGMVVTFHDITELHTLKKALSERYEFHNIIGKSHKMQEIYALIEDVADSDATVLISGDSGTGKELIARAIHHQSRRADGPFVKVNCSALAETLLESELFGHVKGSFTGAYRDKVGRFELANNGSIFLDEIGDVSPNIQLKLLRVLQEREIERVGDSRVIKVNVRIIAATNRNLKKLVEEGTFREDLYYRLNVIPIHLPNLKERREDIPLLVDHFVKKFNHLTGKNIQSLSQKALRLMMEYEWPGNIRQLENAIEHAFVKTHGRVVSVEALPLEIQGPLGAISASRETQSERERIMAALVKAGGNKAKASRALGIDRVTLWRKMRRLQIEYQDETLISE